MVLWSLVLISFLAGEYLDHNRGKAGLAINAWDSLKQKEAVDSVLHLFATDSWPIPGENNKKKDWICLSPGEVALWVKVDRESDRININTAPDNRIRDKLHELTGEGNSGEADQLADAICDWRDTDILVRMNGAEAEFYDSKGLAYRPANGPFKVLTEMLLVKGISRDMFWGEPLSSLLTEEDQDTEPMPLCLLEAFTIYSGDTKRVSVLVPGKQQGYTLVFALFETKRGRWDVLQGYRSMLVTSGKKTQSFDKTESGVELS